MTSKLIGVTRETLDDPGMRIQIAALEGAGCEQILVDRPGEPSNIRRLALRAARRGDAIACRRWSDLGRAIDDVAKFLAQATANEVTVIELDSGLTTESPAIRAAVDRFSAAISTFHSERTTRALAAARGKGVKLGRTPIIPEADWPKIQELLKSKRTITNIAADYSTTRQTVHQYIKRMERAES